MGGEKLAPSVSQLFGGELAHSHSPLPQPSCLNSPLRASSIDWAAGGPQGGRTDRRGWGRARVVYRVLGPPGTCLLLLCRSLRFPIQLCPRAVPDFPSGGGGAGTGPLARRLCPRISAFVLALHSLPSNWDGCGPTGVNQERFPEGGKRRNGCVEMNQGPGDPRQNLGGVGRAPELVSGSRMFS